MTSKLFFQALTKFLAGLVLVGVLLFLPAGTFAYWQGWLFIALLFGPMFIAGVVLLLRQPELLRKRLDAKEKQGEQKWVVVSDYAALHPHHRQRIRNEEAVLEQGLEGYTEYKQKVRYKVIPFVW